MPTYVERLTTQFDELTESIEEMLERAVEEDREISADEKAEIDKLEVNRGELQKSIDHAADLELRRTQVAERLAKISHTPHQRKVIDGAPTTAPDPEKELLREVPNPGAYAALTHRAWVRRDRSAIEALERVQTLLRATAHQTTADNPGLIPRPIVGPLVDRMRRTRPLIASIGVLDAPAAKFDRPMVTQHVDVDVQAAEKDPTVSQKLVTEPVPVALDTYAGHLNISRQDLRWSQPNILNVIYSSFTKVYARRTDKAACTDFAAAVTATQDVDSLDAVGIDDALGAVASVIETADGDMGELNHLWLARDVATRLRGLRSELGIRLYNIPVTGTSGDLDGIPVTIDPRFEAGTAIAGDDTLIEFYEDIEGFLTVDEPDVLGQLVGYAGYTDTIVLDATGFVKLTLPAVTP